MVTKLLIFNITVLALFSYVFSIQHSSFGGSKLSICFENVQTIPDGTKYPFKVANYKIVRNGYTNPEENEEINQDEYLIKLIESKNVSSMFHINDYTRELYFFPEYDSFKFLEFKSFISYSKKTSYTLTFIVMNTCDRQSFIGSSYTFFVEYDPSYIDLSLTTDVAIDVSRLMHKKQIVAKLRKCHQIERTQLVYSLKSTQFKFIDQYPEQVCSEIKQEGVQSQEDDFYYYYLIYDSIQDPQVDIYSYIIPITVNKKTNDLYIAVQGSIDALLDTQFIEEEIIIVDSFEWFSFKNTIFILCFIIILTNTVLPLFGILIQNYLRRYTNKDMIDENFKPILHRKPVTSIVIFAFSPLAYQIIKFVDRYHGKRPTKVTPVIISSGENIPKSLRSENSLQRAPLSESRKEKEKSEKILSNSKRDKSFMKLNQNNNNMFIESTNEQLINNHELSQKNEPEGSKNSNQKNTQHQQNNESKDNNGKINAIHINLHKNSEVPNQGSKSDNNSINILRLPSFESINESGDKIQRSKISQGEYGDKNNLLFKANRTATTINETKSFEENKKVQEDKQSDVGMNEQKSTSTSKSEKKSVSHKNRDRFPKTYATNEKSNYNNNFVRENESSFEQDSINRGNNNNYKEEQKSSNTDQINSKNQVENEKVDKSQHRSRKNNTTCNSNLFYSQNITEYGPIDEEISNELSTSKEHSYPSSPKKIDNKKHENFRGREINKNTQPDVIDSNFFQLDKSPNDYYKSDRSIDNSEISMVNNNTLVRNNNMTQDVSGFQMANLNNSENYTIIIDTQNNLEKMASYSAKNLDKIPLKRSKSNFKKNYLGDNLIAVDKNDSMDQNLAFFNTKDRSTTEIYKEPKENYQYVKKSVNNKIDYSCEENSKSQFEEITYENTIENSNTNQTQTNMLTNSINYESAMEVYKNSVQQNNTSIATDLEKNNTSNHNNIAKNKHLINKLKDFQDKQVQNPNLDHEKLKFIENFNNENIHFQGNEGLKMNSSENNQNSNQNFLIQFINFYR